MMDDGRLVGGYTTSRHLLLDLDHATLRTACKIGLMVQDEYRYVGDLLVCESSTNKHHLIFGAYISWSRIVHVTETLAGLFVLNKDYMKIRRFRHDLTLRITSVDRGKGCIEIRPIPRVYLKNLYYPNDQGILDYLQVTHPELLFKRRLGTQLQDQPDVEVLLDADLC